MPKLIDIGKWFQPSGRVQASRASCRNSAPFMEKVHNYFLIEQKKIANSIYNTSDSFHSATITIGNSFYGRMSYKEQYKHMIKDIKNTYAFNGTVKYVAHFELTKAGMLHCHMLIYGGYAASFARGFEHYGKRNSHKKAYEECRNIEGYLKYINKENIMPPIHNIKKIDLDLAKSYAHLLAPGEAEENCE